MRWMMTMAVAGFFVICEPYSRSLEIKLDVMGWEDREVFYAVYFDSIPDAMNFMAENEGRFKQMTITREEAP